MRVLIVAITAPAKMTGVHRHAINLAKCLLMREDEVDLIIAPWQLASLEDSGLPGRPRFTLHLAKLKPGRIARNLWHCTALSGLVRETGADIVHLTCPVPFLKHLIPRPIVVTLHDLYPIEIRENFGILKSFFNRAILRFYLRGADVITTVSDNTLALLETHMPEVRGKARRIYNSVEALPSAAVIQSPLPGWRGYPFLLCVAQHRRNKNIVLLLRAFHRLIWSGSLLEGTRLVLIGVQGPETGAIEQTVRELQLTSSVVFLEGVSDAELHWCYRNARMLVAPSQTEGFGFPVAEALRAGCRFVCSDIPSFREIDHRVGTYFSLEGDVETNLVKAIQEAAAGPPPAPGPLDRFSPEKISDEYKNLYASLHLQHFSVPSVLTQGKFYDNKL